MSRPAVGLEDIVTCVTGAVQLGSTSLQRLVTTGTARVTSAGHESGVPITRPCALVVVQGPSRLRHPPTATVSGRVVLAVRTRAAEEDAP